MSQEQKAGGSEDIAGILTQINALTELVTAKMGALGTVRQADRGDITEMKIHFDAMRKSLERVEVLMFHGNGSPPMTHEIRSLRSEQVTLRATITELKQKIEERDQKDLEFDRQAKLKVLDRVLAIIGAVGVAALALLK